MLKNKYPVNDKNIAQFVEGLLKEKDFREVEKEVLEELKSDLGQRVEETVNAAVLGAIPPAKLEEFDRLLESGSKEEIASFCEQNVADLQAVVSEALASFRKTYLGI